MLEIIYFVCLFLTMAAIKEFWLALKMLFSDEKTDLEKMRKKLHNHMKTKQR